MTKRVVLIGHPVAHSLSGAMQQAAFDDQGIDATYELWDRPPIGLADAVAELRTDDFLGANVTIPHKERMVPLVDRLTEEAHITGAVNTITKEGKRLVGHNTDVPGFRVALDKLVGRQKMPRHAVVLGAGGGARAVVHGLITEGFQRIIVFNRHLHRAEALVKHFGRSAAHMELRAMPWHESIIEAELAKTKVLVNATSIGLTSDETPVAGRAHAAGAARPRPDLQPDPLPPRGRGGRRDRPRRRADAPPPGRGGVHPLDRQAGAARAHAAEARTRRGPAASDRPRASRPGDAPDAARPARRRRASRAGPPPPTERLTDARGPSPLSDRRRIARPHARGDARGHPGGSSAVRRRRSRSTSRGASAATAAARARRSSRTGRRSSPASATG